MTEVVKKNRRGISNETRTVNRKQFTKADVTPYGVFQGHIENVSVEISEMGEDSKLFPGNKIPRLVFTFASNHANESERRYITNSYAPVPSTVETIPGGKEAFRIDNMFAYIKHMLDVIVLKGRQLSPEEEEALNLDFMDYDPETNEYIPVEDTTVLEAYTKLFNNVAAIFNGKFATEGQEASGKPLYKTPNGGYISIWIKLLSSVKSKNGWQTLNKGNLAFPTFVGTGVFELVKGNNPPAIIGVNPANESIEIKEDKKQPNIGGMIGGAAMPNMGGMPMGMPNMNGTAAMPTQIIDPGMEDVFGA